MRAILIIGVKNDSTGSPQPECLYCGLSGVDAVAAATKAAATKSFIQIGKVAFPSHIPLPIVPEPEFTPKAPAEPKREPAKLPEVAPAPESIQKQETALKTARQKLIEKELTAKTPARAPTPETKNETPSKTEK